MTPDLTTTQAAATLGCSAKTVNNMIRAGRLKATWHEWPVHHWTITAAEVARVAKLPRPKRGRPRTRERCPTCGQPC